MEGRREAVPSKREREKKRRGKTREQFNRQLAVGVGPVDVSPRPSNDNARSERRDQSSCVQDMTELRLPK